MVLIYNKSLILRYLCTTKILFQSIQISQHTNKKRDIDLISFEHKVQRFEWVVDLDSIKAVYWMSDGSWFNKVMEDANSFQLYCGKC